MRPDVEDLIASGDKAVARVTVTGTHKGEFMGVAPTGTRVDMQLIDIHRFDGAGLLGEHWGVADTLSLMQQLGAVPRRPSGIVPVCRPAGPAQGGMMAAVSADCTQIAHSGPPVQVHTFVPAAMHERRFPRVNPVSVRAGL